MSGRYTALKEAPDGQPFDLELSKHRRRPLGQAQLIWFCLIILQLLLVAIYLTSYLVDFPGWTNVSRCTVQLSNWSPGISAIEYETRYFEGKFGATNEYMGTPSEQIDHEWNHVSLNVPALRLFEKDFAAMGKSLTERNWHQIPPEWGGGYLGMTEVFHLLHCLAEIRKLTYPEHYPDLWAERDQRGRRVHTEHCLDIIRQRLMCTADVGPVPFYDDPNYDMPMPDFSTRHQCRNFTKILDWGYTNERAVGWDEVGDLHVPASHPAL